MSTTGRLVLPVGERDHVRGPRDAPLTLLEYGDFECPYCGAAYPEVEAVRERMGDELRFVFRHFPLTTVHPHAQRAAEAAEAAGSQGRFWEMHDLLFESQGDLEDPVLIALAMQLDLDIDRFTEEVKGAVHLPRIREDVASGVRSGVTGTPAFFINGVRYEGTYDASDLYAALRRAHRAQERPRVP